MKKQKSNTKAKFLAYISDFYFAIGVSLFLVAVFLMFNEPVGVSMLSFDMSIVLVAFAILFAVAQDLIVKYLAKYLLLIGFMITTYQFMLDYGFSSTLQIVFWVSIIVFVIVFIFDFISYIPRIVGLIWDMVKRRR